LCARITFDEKPKIAFCELLNALASRSNIATETRQLRSEYGSYAETIFTTLFTLMALQAFLFLINGCVIQLTELKHRAKVLARRNAPKSYSELALSPVQRTSPAMLSVMTGLTTYVKGLTWLKHPDLSGYAKANIKNVTAMECNEVSNDSQS
jgi:hypothetical protein